MSAVVIQRISAEAAPEDAALQVWAEYALALPARGRELVVRLVDAAESQALNKQYRGIDKPTNVLSFPADTVPIEFAQWAEQQAVTLPLGDLVICSAVVNAEAQEQGKAVSAHWAHMVIHGCLHLQGYDHQIDEQAEAMEALERNLLAELNFPDPYQVTQNNNV